MGKTKLWYLSLTTKHSELDNFLKTREPKPQKNEIRSIDCINFSLIYNCIWISISKIIVENIKKYNNNKLQAIDSSSHFTSFFYFFHIQLSSWVHYPKQIPTVNLIHKKDGFVPYSLMKRTMIRFYDIDCRYCWSQQIMKSWYLWFPFFMVAARMSKPKLQFIELNCCENLKRCISNYNAYNVRTYRDRYTRKMKDA